MRYGLFMMPLHPPEKDPNRAYFDDIELLVRADELGFGEAWIGEHLTAQWESIPTPDLLIANVLPRTRQIKLGTGVACLPNHEPSMLAHRIAFLDHLAQGRFLFGIGSGGFPGDFEMYEVDYQAGEQRDLTREAIDAILRLWTEPAPGIYEGKRFRFRVPETDSHPGVRLHMKPFQRPHPPIAVAGVSKSSETLRLAGERGWIPMSINFVPDTMLTSHWETIEQGAERTGQVADRSEWRVARDIYVAETTEQARREVREGAMTRAFEEYLLPLVSSTRQLAVFKNRPEMPTEDVTIDYLLDNVWIVGDPDEVTRKLRALHERVGGFGPVLMLAYDWTPKERFYRSMELLAKEVMPRLADL
jgi:alkanesulfonate monooxygenase SsuD/methylene tetrahydromethanopterin reductase-like flavin-dependent oxidoreductase (luciferase family)